MHLFFKLTQIIREDKNKHQKTKINDVLVYGWDFIDKIMEFQIAGIFLRKGKASSRKIISRSRAFYNIKTSFHPKQG